MLLFSPGKASVNYKCQGADNHLIAKDLQVYILMVLLQYAKINFFHTISLPPFPHAHKILLLLIINY